MLLLSIIAAWQACNFEACVSVALPSCSVVIVYLIRRRFASC